MNKGENKREEEVYDVATPAEQKEDESRQRTEPKDFSNMPEELRLSIAGVSYQEDAMDNEVKKQLADGQIDLSSLNIQQLKKMTMELSFETIKSKEECQLQKGDIFQYKISNEYLILEDTIPSVKKEKQEKTEETRKEEQQPDLQEKDEDITIETNENTDESSLPWQSQQMMKGIGDIPTTSTEFRLRWRDNNSPTRPDGVDAVGIKIYFQLDGEDETELTEETMGWIGLTKLPVIAKEVPGIEKNGLLALNFLTTRFYLSNSYNLV